MRYVKENPVLSVANDFLVDSPLPANISYLWNTGSLLGLVLIIQIVTGVTLAMHYVPNTLYAFASVEHIMRDVNYGWLIRYMHANGASFFFIVVYLHIGRGLYYGSYRPPRTLLWSVGVVIYIIMMATAFLGYVLPWGQMSYWGATVITNLFSVIPWIGQDLVYFIWGGYSVDNATLNRFFSLHFLLPFILAALAAVHLMALHQYGSTNPLSLMGDRLRFHPYFTSKDYVGFLWLFLLLGLFVFFMPNAMGHPDNYIPANPLVTPHSIVPEWYFLPFYAILRSIPNKTLGVIAMFSSLLILLALPWFTRLRVAVNTPLMKFLFWFFVVDFFLLMWLGGQPIHSPYVQISQIATAAYFGYFILLCIIG